MSPTDFALMPAEVWCDLLEEQGQDVAEVRLWLLSYATDAGMLGSNGVIPYRGHPPWLVGSYWENSEWGQGTGYGMCGEIYND